MIFWWCDQELNGGAAARAFSTMQEVFELDGERITQDPLSWVVRVEREGKRYYVKRYVGNGKNALRRWFGLRQWLAPTRVKKEWQNLLRFQEWGIPTARLAAYGIENRYGGFRRGALITEEIRDTADLATLALQQDVRLRNSHWVGLVSAQIARITRRMHEAGFVHNDLKWRNVLVTHGDAPTVYLIDCPSGGNWWGPFLQYRIVKDLACLDKVAKYQLTRSQRLRFYLDYVQRPHLTEPDKTRVRKIIRFLGAGMMALSEPPRQLPVSELCHGGRAPEVPFQVRGEDGEIITLERLLRVLPGKRIVGEARWRDRHVLAKLFVARHSSRHWARERQGLESLRTANISTPGIVAAGRLDGGGHYLLTEFLPDSRTLAEHWSAIEKLPPENPAAQELLQPAFALLGRLHAAGLLQNDLHLGNFLAYRNELFVIDGDGVVSMGKGAAAAAQQSMENLALLIAQLPLSWEDCLDSLVAAYTSEQERWRPGREALLQAVERVRAWRLSRFLTKTLRDCSQFSVRSTSSRFSVVVRSEKEALSALMEDPDGFMMRGQLLKDGNTCTVARVDIGGRTLVVKRYNLKSFRHALSRFWRPSRAWHSWLAGHRLAFYGIPTPAPLAMLEERIGPMRGRAFLVTEFCPGESLLQHLSEDREPDTAEAEAIRNLFAMLFRLKISHGDMKASNLLWHGHVLSMIDLDSMVQHNRLNAFINDWRRDRERFLRNWPKHSPLCLWLAASLPEI